MYFLLAIDALLFLETVDIFLACMHLILQFNKLNMDELQRLIEPALLGVLELSLYHFFPDFTAITLILQDTIHNE